MRKLILAAALMGVLMAGTATPARADVTFTHHVYAPTRTAEYSAYSDFEVLECGNDYRVRLRANFKNSTRTRTYITKVGIRITTRDEYVVFVSTGAYSGEDSWSYGPRAIRIPPYTSWASNFTVNRWFDDMQAGAFVHWAIMRAQPNVGWCDVRTNMVVHLT